MPNPSPRLLVTAGNTREMIDRVRDWGNIFTGGTGLSIARALSVIGPVDLLTSNRAHIEQFQSQPAGGFPIHPIPFSSHADLRSQLAGQMKQQTYHAVFMTAAVADYKPAGAYQVLERRVEPDGRETWIVQNAQAGKVKSTHPAIAILGARTEKIVNLFRGEWGYRGLLFKFKLEVGLSKEDLIRVGQASRTASGADYLVANTLEMVEGPDAGAYLLSDDEPRWIARTQLAAELAGIVRERVVG